MGLERGTACRRFWRDESVVKSGLEGYGGYLRKLEQ